MAARRRKTSKSKRMVIVKRHGHTEKYDHRKIYGSVFAACLASHVPEAKAEKIADSTCKTVDKWVKSKKSVTAHHIHLQATKHLKKHNKNAAFMYETHMDIS